MSAPILWIFLPLVLAGLLLLITNQKFVFLLACLFTLFLTMAAWLLPIDSALTIGGLTFKLAPSIQILGQPVIPGINLWLCFLLVYPGGFLTNCPAHDSVRTGHNLPAGCSSGGAAVPLCRLDH